MLTFRFPFGPASGLLVGLMLGIVRSVWMEFLVARLGLAALRRVQWRFMSFLADATSGGVL